MKTHNEASESGCLGSSACLRRPRSVALESSIVCVGPPARGCAAGLGRTLHGSRCEVGFGRVGRRDKQESSLRNAQVVLRVVSSSGHALQSRAAACKDDHMDSGVNPENITLEKRRPSPAPAALASLGGPAGCFLSELSHESASRGVLLSCMGAGRDAAVGRLRIEVGKAKATLARLPAAPAAKNGATATGIGNGWRVDPLTDPVTAPSWRCCGCHVGQREPHASQTCRSVCPRVIMRSPPPTSRNAGGRRGFTVDEAIALARDGDGWVVGRRAGGWLAVVWPGGRAAGQVSRMF